MANITYTNTRCIARFFPYKKPYLQADPNFTVSNTNELLETEEFVEKDKIIACSVNKSKGLPSATFNLILKENIEYINKLKPGTWVLIYLDDEVNLDLEKYEGNKGLKIFGNIDRISKNKTVLGNGAVQVAYNIVGRDFGKFFEKSEFFYDPYVADIRAKEMILYGYYGIDYAGTPADFVEKYLDIFLGHDDKYKMLHVLHIPPLVASTLQKGLPRAKGSALAFYDLLKRKIDKENIKGYAPKRDIGKITSDSLWGMLQNSTNTMLNELFLDLKPSSAKATNKEFSSLLPSLIMRPIPMTLNELLKITPKPIEIFEEDITQDDLGLSDNEKYNYLVFTPTNLYQKGFTWLQAAEGYLPKINRESLIRYGLYKIDRTTDFGVISTGEKKDKKEEINHNILREWADRLEEYWFNYWKFHTGTIELKGISNFQVGEMIKIPERKMMYMVESYEYVWQFGQSVSTVLTLTHGMSDTGEYVLDIDKV